MNSKVILTSYSILLCSAGILMLFLGDEIVSYLHLPQSDILNILLGGLLFGFGLVNWHSKNLTVGGIYGRPLLIGNLGHCLIGSISFIKLTFSNPTPLILSIAFVYSVFAILFTYLMYSHPKPNNN
ncbi:MAG: hypothetical protein RLO81_03935 [Fulvivirga sp.]|uniref:hypothetical protein n=1 Tax=Fulvivirga sp. TaxID=1931237 RepID=UPI0032EAEB3E